MKVWLIQRGGNRYDGPEYFCAGTWISSPDTFPQATRFNRREDAEHIIRLIKHFHHELPFRASLAGWWPSEPSPFPTEMEFDR